MATWLIIVIAIAVADFLMAFIAYYMAEDKGQDPMSAFIATMLFSIVGLVLTLMMANRNENKASSYNVEHEVNTQEGSAMLFFSNITGKYHMEYNGNPVGVEDEQWVLSSKNVVFTLKDPKGKIKDISVNKANELLSPNWK